MVNDLVIVLPLGAMRYAGLIKGAGLGNQAIQWSKGFALADTLGADVKFVFPFTSPHSYQSELSLANAPVSLARAALGCIRRRGEYWLYPRESWLTYKDELPSFVAAERIPQRDRIVTIPVHRNIDGLFLPGRRGLHRLRQWFTTDLGVNIDNTFDMQLRIAVHLRAGDFTNAAATVNPGTANERWPTAWSFQRTVTAARVAEDLGMTPIVSVVSDSAVLARQFAQDLLDNGVSVNDSDSKAGHIRSDLAALASAHYVVPSGSTFSLLALALGQGYFAWHFSHLGTNGEAAWLLPPFCGGGNELASRLAWSDRAATATEGVRRAIAIGDTSNVELESAALAHRFDLLRRQGPQSWLDRSFTLDLAATGLAEVIR